MILHAVSLPPGPSMPGFIQTLGMLSRPEYGTPACDDVRDVVVHDKAGNRATKRITLKLKR